MAFQNIREIIDEKIIPNGQQKITGGVLNNVLHRMVDVAYLNMSAPIIHKVPALDAQELTYLSIRHPLLDILPDAELVLMHLVPGGKSRRVPKDPPLGAIHYSSGWRVCSKETEQGSLFPITPMTGQWTLFDYIVRNYIHGTFVDYYDFMNTYIVPTEYANPLYYSRYYFTHPRNFTHMFGIALRVENPEFNNLVVGPLSKDTHSIASTNKIVYRYLYSAVAPFQVVSLPHKAGENTFRRELHILIK